MASYEFTPELSFPDSPWLNTAEAAEYIRCTPGTLKTWRAKGAGPKYHVVSSRMVRYHTDDLDAFMRRESGL